MSAKEKAWLMSLSKEAAKQCPVIRCDRTQRLDGGDWRKGVWWGVLGCDSAR
ncbi:hypothetical protein [Ktedonobacter racemifer]|uniref:hypothetical protein n=1 Tax=Ktedonobacter racemifer TaxID=363277 RepID=UPI0002E508A1|nr:hypothetical protein [Ktedonobacter racemifer]